MSRLEKGTKVPSMGLDKAESQAFAATIADALRAELGSRSVAKTVARWTGPASVTGPSRNGWRERWSLTASISSP